MRRTTVLYYGGFGFVGGVVFFAVVYGLLRLAGWHMGEGPSALLGVVCGAVGGFLLGGLAAPWIERRAR